MGNVHDQPPPCHQAYAAPMFKTPFTDYMLPIINFQNRKDCGQYELHYVDCMEAYGHKIGNEKCRLIYHDLHECVYRTKQMRRAALMRVERHRQYKNGEREKEYPEIHPPLDLF